jgi:hypothetical protein
MLNEAYARPDELVRHRSPRGFEFVVYHAPGEVFEECVEVSGYLALPGATTPPLAATLLGIPSAFVGEVRSVSVAGRIASHSGCATSTASCLNKGAAVQ